MLLYHEPQVAALCAVHCLNTLLQGPYFTEVELAQIAQELDAMERQLLGGAAADAAGNVDGSGMFSSQVLSRALSVWNLTITPITSPEMKGVAEEPQKECAFICNLEEHWFTIRRLGADSWFNFNSIYPAPESLSTFYLAAFLGSLREQGYTIFVVRGDLPRPTEPTSAAAGKWFTPDEAKQAVETAAEVRQQGRVKNTVENVFARAAQSGGRMQLRPRGEASQPAAGALSGEDEWEMAGGDEDLDLAAAIAASLQDAGGAGGGAESAAAAGADFQVPNDLLDDDDMDPEYAAAIAASLQDLPPPSPAPAPPPAPVEPLADEPAAGTPDVIELGFRLPTGSRATRRFPTTATTSQLYRYLEVEHGLPPSSFSLSLQFPRQDVASSSTATLQESGLQDRQVLAVGPCK